MYLDDPTIDDTALEILRRTTFPEILSERYVLAVAGAQGAGKTTLIREIYELDDTWLPANAGQGEQEPLLVTESSTAREAQGWVIEIAQESGEQSLVRTDLTPEDFRGSLRGLSGQRLVLGLTVPATFLGQDDRGFLLLPGYESTDAENREWQGLMRQALVAAPAVLVVVDRTLLASDAQQTLIDDMRRRYLEDAVPLVAISKTERLAADDPERAQLVVRAAELFAIPAGHSRVVATGSGDEAYRKVWLAELKDLMAATLPGARRMRLRQLRGLRRTVRTDVNDLRRHVRDATYGQAADPGALSYRHALVAYDDAAQRVLDEYLRNVREELDVHRRKAADLVDEVIAENSTNEARREQTKEYLLLRGYLVRRELERRFEDCWRRAGTDNRGFAAGHLSAARQAILGLGPLLRDSGLRLGADDANVFADLSALGRVRENGHTFDNLMQHVALLPLMALEAARTAMEAPQLVGVSPETLVPDHAVTEPDVQAALAAIGEERLALLAGFGAALGVDLVGETQAGPQALRTTLHTYLFGGAGVTRAAGAASTTLAGIVAVATLAVAVAVYGNRTGYRQASLGRQITDAIYEAHLTKIESEFVRLLKQLRRQVEFALSRYFGVDVATSRTVEIERALAETDTARQRLLDVLDDAGF